MSVFKKEISQWNSKQIDEKINDHLEIRTVEKNKYGEVFTPRVLIDELVDSLPAHVWTNPTLKWLDPACGIGNFAMVIYERLMNGLKKALPSRQKRSNHILSEMIYMVDINPDNVKRAKEIFSEKANIRLGNYLELEMSNLFDIVIGNPPFQNEVKVRTEKKGGTPLWDRFVCRALDNGLKKTGGYLAFITPAGWRKPESPLWNKMTRECTLRFLHIYSKKDALRMFGVHQRVDSYLIEKVTSHSSYAVSVTDETGKNKLIRPSQWRFLPNTEFDLIYKLLVPNTGITKRTVKNNPTLEILYSRNKCGTDRLSMSKQRSAKHPFPVIHIMNKEGIGLWYSNHQDCFFGIPKVIVGVNEKLYCYNDWEGKYGLSQNTFGIVVKNKREGEIVKKTLDSEWFKNVIIATKWGAFQIDHRMFKFFKRYFYKEGIHNRNKTKKLAVNASL